MTISQLISIVLTLWLVIYYTGLNKNKNKNKK